MGGRARRLGMALVPVLTDVIEERDDVLLVLFGGRLNLFLDFQPAVLFCQEPIRNWTDESNRSSRQKG